MTEYQMVPVDDARPYRTVALAQIDALAMLNKKPGIWARTTDAGLEFGLSPMIYTNDTGFVPNQMTDADLDRIEAWLRDQDATPGANRAGDVNA